MITLWVSLAGAIGAVSRFVLDGLIRQRWSGAPFPWATMLINVSGSLLLGILTGLVLFRGSPDDLKLMASDWPWCDDCHGQVDPRIEAPTAW